MRSLFQPFTNNDRHSRIGATGNDVRTLVYIPRIVHGFHFQTEAIPDFLGIRFAVGFRWAVNLNLFDFARQQKRFDVGKRHAARADHPDHFRILPRHILCADTRVSSHSHMLQIAVINKRDGLAVLNAGQEDQAAKPAGPETIFFLRDRALIFLFVNHVRFHANGKISGYRAAFHSAPLIDFFRILCRDLNIDSWAAYGFLPRQLGVSLFERLHGNFHGEHLFHIVVVETQSHGSFSFRRLLSICSGVLRRNPLLHYTSTPLLQLFFISPTALQSSLRRSVPEPRYCRKTVPAWLASLSDLLLRLVPKSPENPEPSPRESSP